MAGKLRGPVQAASPRSGQPPGNARHYKAKGHGSGFHPAARPPHSSSRTSKRVSGNRPRPLPARALLQCDSDDRPTRHRFGIKRHSVGLANHQGIERRDDEQGRDQPRQDAADDRTAERARSPRCPGPGPAPSGPGRRRRPGPSSPPAGRGSRPPCGSPRSGVSPSCVAQVLGEVDQQHRVRDHDADHEDHAQQRLHVDRRPGQVEHQHHADQPQRHGEEDHQRGQVRLEQAPPSGSRSAASPGSGRSPGCGRSPASASTRRSARSSPP